MRHLAAYLLLVIGGNTTPSKEDITKLLGTVGIEVDSDRLSLLIAELDGKDLGELVALGRDKLMVGGGGGGGASKGSAPATATADASKSAEVPAAKEAEKPKVEEVDALEGGMDMFGGGGGGGGDY